MSKSKLTFKRNVTNKLLVKGILSEDRTFIAYMDENDIEQNVKVTDLLKAFINQPIEFCVSLKSDEDLDLIISEDEEE